MKMIRMCFSPATCWLFVALCSALFSGCGSMASLNPLGSAQSWEEEALLHDGRKLVVTRWLDRGGRHELGQRPPIKEQGFKFTMPDTGQKIVWEDHFSPELGSANFLPNLVDIDNNTAYLVAKPMGCLSYNKWGRPNPPYVVFKYTGSDWQRINLDELPAEIKTPNIISSFSRDEEKLITQGFVTAEMIRKLYEGYRIIEHKTILREPLSGENQCGEMIPDGHQGWIGISWFRNQPSYEACVMKCKDNQLSAEYCPCDRLFKGEK